MANTTNFGNQYKCVDCGAVWDANDHEGHDCLAELPSAGEVRASAHDVGNTKNAEQMRQIKSAVNEMLRDGKTTTYIYFTPSKSVLDHLAHKGYKVENLPTRPNDGVTVRISV